MIKNIYAFTEAGSEFPAYISVNDVHGDEVTITIRGKARNYEFGGKVSGSQASISLDEEQLRELWRNLYVHLSRKKT